jgi:hypothetical protein
MYLNISRKAKTTKYYEKEGVCIKSDSNAVVDSYYFKKTYSRRRGKESTTEPPSISG